MTKKELLEVILRLPNDMELVIMLNEDGSRAKRVTKISLDYNFNPDPDDTGEGIIWFDSELGSSDGAYNGLTEEQKEYIKSQPRTIVLS